MYNVLIADDDALIRNGLATLIDWESFDTVVSATSANAESALDVLSKGKIDILITDICMPGKTGLELLREARTYRPNLKCIVISSYSDFSYVKEAARLGIENYILKPIDDQELKNTVSSTVEKLDTETHRHKLEEDGLDVLRGNILSRLLFGEIDEYELCDKAEFIQFNLYANEYGLCCAQSVRSGGFSREVINSVKESLRKWDDVKCFVFLDPEDHLITIFSGSDITAEEAVIRARTESVYEQIEKSYDCITKLSFSGIVPSYKQLPACYEHACSSLRESLSSGSMIVQKVQEYLSLHYMDDINLKVVSGLFHMNAFYLGRLYRETAGSSFTDALNHLRIEHAKTLLATGRYKASDAALQVGYTNTNYFYTIFKKMTGSSPASYSSRSHSGSVDTQDTEGHLKTDSD
jgi:two-component system response regulator YesN